MARVLIGWELGANRGHISKIEKVARRLLDEGHDVALALQQTDSVGTDPDPRLKIWQAPIWSRLLTSGIQPNVRAVTTMGDILGRLGLDKPGMLAALVRAWDGIFEAFDPQFVVADFAPGMLVAAKGRILSAQTGTGFACPPFDAPSFTPLVEGDAAYDEADILDIVDADLRSVGREPLSALPAVFASDYSLIVSLPMLDPYVAARRERHCRPATAQALPSQRTRTGDEVFVYLYHQVGHDAAVWEGLAKCGRKVRVHMTASAEHIARFRALGLIYEPHPLSFEQIAARSRIVLSHGGHGFLASSLAARLPQVVTWYDLEKRLYGRALSAAGLAAETNLFATSPEAIAGIVDSVYRDAEMVRKCEAAADMLAETEFDNAEDRFAQIAASA